MKVSSNRTAIFDYRRGIGGYTLMDRGGSTTVEIIRGRRQLTRSSFRG